MKEGAENKVEVGERKIYYLYLANLYKIKNERMNNMGVYINLDIVPSKIHMKGWEAVYQETLELINAYPFADIKVDHIYNIERIFIGKTEEIIEEDSDKGVRHWRICGDLESRRTAEYFTLYNDLSKYSCSRGKDIEDILEFYLHDERDGIRSIFNAKTQGEKYHLYVLAIACLIESRFPKYVMVYGDITKEQAEIAIEWANSILKKPIQLPIRTDYEELASRLKGLGKENVLGSFMSLKIGENGEELNKFIVENFDKEEINRYYMSELKGHYTSPDQLGTKKILIDYLNMEYSLEELSDLYCYNEDGPRFDGIDFIKAIADTWLFIPLRDRECMKGVAKSPGNPAKVYHQFGIMILNMGFLGRINNKYISLNEGLTVLNDKFPGIQDIRGIVEDKNAEIIGALKNIGNELNQIFESVNELHEDKIIDDFDDLMYYKPEYQLSQSVKDSVVRVKEFALNIVKNNEDIIEILREFNTKEDFIKYLVRGTKKDNLLLSQEAWNWIERIDNIEVYKLLVGIVLTTGSENVRNLKKAVFENKEFFREYAMLNNKENRQESENVNKNISVSDKDLADIESIVDKLKEIHSGLELLSEGKVKKEDVMKLVDELEEKTKEK